MSEIDDRATLEQSLRNNPSDARGQYLLGADLAQAGEYDRAIVAMQRAIELDPTLHTARLQLGLLHLTMAHPELSLATWAPLESQPEDALRLFKRGLESLIRNEYANCIAQLDAGIRANIRNPALNRDMQLVIDRVRPLLNPPATTGSPAVRTDFSLYDVTRH